MFTPSLELYRINIHHLKYFCKHWRSEIRVAECYSLVEFPQGLLYDWKKKSSKEMENIYDFI